MEEGRGPAPAFYHTIECIRLGVYPVPGVIPISDYPKARDLARDLARDYHTLSILSIG